MELLYKPDFNRAKKYWDAFWNKEIIDRPVVCVTSPKKGMVQKECPPYMNGADGQFGKALQYFEAWASTTYFGGEAIPVFEPTFGPDQFSAFLGAELVMAEDAHTSWAVPFVESWDEINLVLSDSNTVWKKMLGFIGYAAKYSENKFLISTLDYHGNMDCLSAIRSPEKLCYDLYDYPDKVEKVMKQVRNMYVPIYEGVYKAGNMKNTGTSSWIPFYCEGKFTALQCDFQCMLSPDDEKRFVLPALEEEASYLDHSVFHYDGKEALRHLDDILAIDAIDVIQWVPGAGQPRTVEWMDLLVKIQKAKKGLWLYDWTIEEIKMHYRELKPEGLCFSIQASSENEAEDLLEWFKQNT
jgi:hypothetical protein